MLVPQPNIIGETIANAMVFQVSEYTIYDKCTIKDDLHRKRLNTISFIDCDLTGTCLDPNNVPNGVWAGEPGIGYRTQTVQYLPMEFTYKLGETYEATVFSTSNRECHPGLYVIPNLKFLCRFHMCTLIKVKFDPKDVHCANGKYRVKKFTVLEEIKHESRPEFAIR